MGTVAVVADVTRGVTEVVLTTPTVFWKHEQALLMLGVANELTKLGRIADVPAGSAKKLGQKEIASPVKASRALKTSSSKQMVGSAVAVVETVEDCVAEVVDAAGVPEATVFWKHEQALLMLGEANALT